MLGFARSRWAPWAGLAFALAVTVVLYSGHFEAEFHFDDSHTIETNLYIRSLDNLPCFFADDVAPCHTRAVATFSSLPPNASYRPLVTTTLALDYWLGGGLVPFWFHLDNFIVFLLLGVSLFALYRHWFRQFARQTGDSSTPAIMDGLALLAATAFLWHPVSAETVNYVIARSDLLSTLGVVLGFVALQSGPDWARRFHLYLIPVALGALAKPTAIVFAPLLGAYSVYLLEPPAEGERSVGRALWRGVAHALVAAIVCIAVFAWARHMERGFYDPGGRTEPWRYALTQPWVYVHYVTQWLAPFHLSADTDLRPFAHLLGTSALLGYAAVATGLGVLVVALRRPSLRPYAFCTAWFLVALAPTSFVPLAEVMNDHRMLFPGVALVAGVSWAGYRATQRISTRAMRGVAVAAVALLMVAYAFGTTQRVHAWSSEENLWKDVTVKSPKNGRGHMNYGLALMVRGDLETAESEFRYALALLPNYPYGHTNLAIVLAALGQVQEAESHHLQAIRLGPQLPEMHYYYGRFLAEQRRLDEAIERLYESTKLSDSYLASREALMGLLVQNGRYGEARAVAEHVLRGQPEHALALSTLAASGRFAAKQQADEAIVAGLESYRRGDFAAALGHFERARDLLPDYAEAHNNMCSALNQLGRFAEAAEACRQALKWKPDFPHARGNLGVAERGMAASGSQ